MSQKNQPPLRSFRIARRSKNSSPEQTTKNKTPIVFAFIDSQNLNLGISYDVRNTNGKIVYHGRKLDYRRFRHYLREKFNVSEAYLFLGYVADNDGLYEYLQKCGYTLVFKEVAEFINENGEKIIKGNVDTDIVLYSAAIKFADYDEAIFVSGDGDFLSLYQFLSQQHKLARILVPNQFRYSKLLKQFKSKLFFVSNQKSLFTSEYRKTGSSGRITSLGMPGNRDNPTVTNLNQKVNSRPKRNPK